MNTIKIPNLQRKKATRKHCDVCIVYNMYTKLENKFQCIYYGLFTDNDKSYEFFPGLLYQILVIILLLLVLQN